MSTFNRPGKDDVALALYESSDKAHVLTVASDARKRWAGKHGDTLMLGMK